MSENVENIENENENAETVETPDKSEFAAFDKVLTVIKVATDDANSDAKRRKDLIAQGKGALDSILNESEDEKVVAYRNFRDQALAKVAEINAALDEAKSQVSTYAQTLVPEVSQETLDALKASYLAKREGVTAARKTLLFLLGNDEATFKRALDAYNVVDIISSAGGKTTTNNPTGIVRKRLSEASYNGTPVADGDGKTSFTLLASKSGVDGDEIRDAMAKAADVESVKDIASGQTVEFTIENGGKSHNFVVTAK